MLLFFGRLGQRFYWKGDFVQGARNLHVECAVVIHESFDLRLKSKCGFLNESLALQISKNVNHLFGGLVRVAIITRGGNAVVIIETLSCNKSTLNWNTVDEVAL